MSNEVDTGSSLREERAKARWSILRNVLLEKARCSTSPTQRHSIHRFPGYQLVERRRADTKPIVASIRDFKWNSEISIEDNVQKLAMVCLAVAAAFPTGKRINIHNAPPSRIRASWMESLKAHCESTVSIKLMEEERFMSILIQENSKASKFSVYEYVLDHRWRILTREPREPRLSLTDLVSHRTVGVDNTGNICVWDSEKTLAYLLYHHLDAFANDVFFMSQPPFRILELGTGMAGLAAVATAMRLLNESKSNDTATPTTPIEVTLTDGHVDGVQNNQVNQVLTKASLGADSLPGYVGLRIMEKVLLWTISEKSEGVEPQDLVLASDCTHFQSFHAALAITTLRSLRVDGSAIFCQPTRADSLDNFCSLLQSVPDLLSLEWMQHPTIEDCDVRAKASYPDLYDATLHYPKLLIVRKLRDLTMEDCNEFAKQQNLREIKTETTL